MISTARYHQLGQGMVEYIIIVALIALAAIAAFTYFGDTVRGQTVQMANQVAGVENDEGSELATDAAETATDELLDAGEVGLGNYQEQDAEGL